VPGAAVHAVVEEHFREAKKLAFKKKRRKGYQRLKGHRQVRRASPETSATVSPERTRAVILSPRVGDALRLAFRRPTDSPLSPFYSHQTQELTSLRISRIVGMDGQS
jgi:hypothetical protein